MSLTRRKFLGILSGGFAFAVSTVGSWIPSAVKAAWAKDFFAPNEFDQTLASLTQGRNITETDAIDLDIRTRVTDGKSVRVAVTTSLENVYSVSLLVKKNPRPLSCYCTFSDKTEPYVATRIKMHQSSEVIALVQSGNEFFIARKNVEVKMSAACREGEQAT